MKHTTEMKINVWEGHAGHKCPMIQHNCRQKLALVPLIYVPVVHSIAVPTSCVQTIEIVRTRRYKTHALQLDTSIRLQGATIAKYINRVNTGIEFSPEEVDKSMA